MTDDEFDAEMRKSRAAFIEHYNATFDFEAGLDDVYERAGLSREAARARAAGETTVFESGEAFLARMDELLPPSSDTEGSP